MEGMSAEGYQIGLRIIPDWREVHKDTLSGRSDLFDLIDLICSLYSVLRTHSSIRHILHSAI